MKSSAPKIDPNIQAQETFDVVGSVPFALVHFAALGIFITGASWIALAVAAALYAVRMFGITAGFHRYFSHRSYETSRFFQFVIAFVASSSAQRGVLWWASHHRHHHRYSDQPEDIHSPVQRSLWWSHVGWILCRRYVDQFRSELIEDFLKYPELRWINRYHHIPAILLAVGCFFLGVFLERYFPQLGTDGMQMLVVGFFVSTVILYHSTFTINSLSHKFGNKRYTLKDDSRNNIWLALLTFGEGWHNNHHRYPQSERQGFYWWEIDISHYGLKALSYLGLVWNLKTPPDFILKSQNPQ